MDIKDISPFATIGSFIITLLTFLPKVKEHLGAWRFVVYSVFLFLSGIGTGIFIIQPYITPLSPPILITDFGAVGRVHSEKGVIQILGPKQSTLTVNGSLLSSLASKNYKLIGVVYHYMISGDVHDQPNISKSGLYDIVNHPITITIPWNEQFTSEMLQAQKLSDTLYAVSQQHFALLAVPKGVTPNDFTTLRQAIAFGAQVLQWTAGGQ
jgi:hypothetical protein